MDWLKANSNLKWCGYYFAAPNGPECGWTGQYNSLKSNWGVLPIYVGQQDPRTATANYKPSSILTSQQGSIDGGKTASLMANDGFPSGSFVYLDWEQGDITAVGATDYIRAWVSAVAADGRANPAIYCAHGVAQSVRQIIASINPVPSTRFWCWMVSEQMAEPHPFTGDLANLPTIDPTGCGYAGAQMWQREQNAIVTFTVGAPMSKLQVDFSTSSLADPGSPTPIV